MGQYYTYLLRCADQTLYTGITTDLERRVHEHNTSEKGAKYTKGRRPVQVQYFEIHPTRSNASRRETEIKRLRRLDKEMLIALFAKTRH